MDNVSKFVSHDVPALETLTNARAYILLEKLNNGAALTREEKNHIPAEGAVKVMGYRFNFAPFCKRFLVRYKYCGWREELAIDKTNVRARCPNSHDILEIVEIPA